MKEKTPTNPYGAGRPSLYTPELAQKICERIAAGEPIYLICKENGMPSRDSVDRWQSQHPDFAANCARAKRDRADLMAKKHHDVVDKVMVGELPPDVARVALSGLEWQAKVMNPKAYGNKVETEISGKDGGALTFETFLLGVKDGRSDGDTTS